VRLKPSFEQYNSLAGKEFIAVRRIGPEDRSRLSHSRISAAVGRSVDERFPPHSVPYNGRSSLSLPPGCPPSHGLSLSCCTRKSRGNRQAGLTWEHVIIQRAPGVAFLVNDFGRELPPPGTFHRNKIIDHERRSKGDAKQGLPPSGRSRAGSAMSKPRLTTAAGVSGTAHRCMDLVESEP
jgi:hypothetical protein